MRHERLACRRTEAANVRSNTVPKQTQPASGRVGRIAGAMEALEEARDMPPGSQRAQALKQAGLLRHAADNQGLIFVERGRPRAK
jgi:hypothetical protein